MVFRTGRADIIALGPETGVLRVRGGHPRHRPAGSRFCSGTSTSPASGSTRSYYPRRRVRAALASDAAFEDPALAARRCPVSRDADGRSATRPEPRRSALGPDPDPARAVPHFIVLAFRLLTAWWLTTIVAWFRHPGDPHAHPRGALQAPGVFCALQWLIRVRGAYMLLLVDEACNRLPVRLGELTGNLNAKDREARKVLRTNSRASGPVRALRQASSGFRWLCLRGEWS